MSRIILVRHGQASWGKKNYDKLSELGHEQARVAGRELAAREVTPAFVVSGSMQRQRETAAGLIAGAAEIAGAWPEVEVSAAWDEYSHQDILTAYKPAYRSMTVMKADLARTLKPRRAFDEMYAFATERWVASEFDHDYPETFTAFGERVLAGLDAVSMRLGRGESAIVVSSAGAIAWVATSLISGGGATWTTMHRVLVNASFTTVSVGGGGPTLRTLNDSTHVERDPRLFTIR